MTELEGFQLLGWPPEGKGFILPLSGNTGTEYVAMMCECGMAQLSISQAVASNCPACGREMKKLKEK